MQKRVFIVHGWHGTQDKNWFPWLKAQLETRGYLVYVPQLPDPDYPRIEKWIPTLANVVGKADEHSYFIGHSLGCQAIARYLETMPKEVTIGGVVFVAGFFKRLTNIEDKETERHWLKSPIDLAKVRTHVPKSIALFSDNDPWVPLDNQVDFKQKLGSKIIVKRQMGHFNWRDGVDRLQTVLSSLLEIAN